VASDDWDAAVVGTATGEVAGSTAALGVTDTDVLAATAGPDGGVAAVGDVDTATAGGGTEVVGDGAADRAGVLEAVHRLRPSHQGPPRDGASARTGTGGAEALRVGCPPPKPRATPAETSTTDTASTADGRIPISTMC
jgi:hypothetical protein